MTCWLTAGKQNRAYQRLSDGLEIACGPLLFLFSNYDSRDIADIDSTNEAAEICVKLAMIRQEGIQD